MLGGVTCGYCAMGSVHTATPPANVITMDSTAAKIGRSMKNRENKVDPRRWSDYLVGWVECTHETHRTLARPTVGLTGTLDPPYLARSLVTADTAFGAPPLGASTAFSRTFALSRTRCKPLNTTISPAARLLVMTRMPF